MSNSKLVNVNFKINVGAKNEKANTSGLSHLVEHAVFLGCDKYSLQDIENKIKKGCSEISICWNEICNP